MKIRKRNERLYERKYTFNDIFQYPNAYRNLHPYYDFTYIHFFDLFSDGTVVGLHNKYPWIGYDYSSEHFNSINKAYDESLERTIGEKCVTEYVVKKIKAAIDFLHSNLGPSDQHYINFDFDDFMNYADNTTQHKIIWRRSVLETAIHGHSNIMKPNSYFIYSFQNEFLNLHGKELNHLYEAFIADYNPIENYDMKESETTNTSGDRDITNSQDTTGKTEYGKVIDNDRTTTEATTLSGTTNTKNTGTDTTDIKTDNTQTSDGNVKRTGTTTETRALTNTNNTTDDNTQTDNLSETVGTTGINTRTDNLNESITEHNDNTRTDALKEAISSTDDNNKTINTTETRTDALKEVESKNGTDTKTSNMSNKTIYNSTTNESNNIDVSGSNKSTRTDDLKEATSETDKTEYGKTINLGIDGSTGKNVNSIENYTDTKTMDRHYSTTTEETYKDSEGNVYKEIVGEPDESGEGVPYTDKKIFSGGYEDTSTYNHERTEPQARSTKTEETTSGSSKTTNTDETSRAAFNAANGVYSDRDKIVNTTTQDQFPTTTTTTTPVPGSDPYKVVERTAENSQDKTKRMYSLPTDVPGEYNDYKETNQQIGTRLRLEGGKTVTEKFDDISEDNKKSKEVNEHNGGNNTSETGTNSETQITTESGIDTLTKTGSISNTGTQKNEEIISKTEDTHLVNNKSGDDTVLTTGTEVNEVNETVARDNTGTQTNKVEGKEDDLHTIESTKDNTGTVTEVIDGTTSRANTGTVKEDISENVTKSNTGTVKNNRTIEETANENGTVTIENNLSDTTVNTVTDDGTQKNTRTLDLTETGTTSSEENVTGTDKLKISTTGEDNTTENMSGKSKELSNEEITRILTRSGNIGVTTSQQMITASIVLYSQYSFLEILTQLVKNYLTIDVY